MIFLFSWKYQKARKSRWFLNLWASYVPGWKCCNNLLAIILALIFEPLACMKMAYIYTPHIYVPVWKWGRVKIRLWSQLVPHLCLEVQRDIQSTTILSQEKYSFYGKRFILWMWRCKQPAPSRWSAHRVQMPLLITWRWFGWQLCYGMFFQNLSTGTLSNIQYHKRKTLLNITSF